MANWISNRASLRQQIQEEIAKNQALQAQSKQLLAEDTTLSEMSWQSPATGWITQPQQNVQPEIMDAPQATRQPANFNINTTRRSTPAVTQPQRVVQQATTTPAVEQLQQKDITQPVDKPFWARALEVFAKPFEWVDDYIIKPTMGIAFDAAVPNVERKAGEDYFKWKARSWDEWNAPGFTLNMPWGKWKIDVKGIAENAPWLLIPGAGQIGGAIRGVAMGAKVGSTLAKIAPALNVVGKVIQYSPWGLVEKGTGAVVKGATSVIGKSVGKATTKISNKLYGAMPTPQPPSPAVNKLTGFFKEQVKPAFSKFQEVGKKELRERQGGIAARLRQDYVEGRITRQQYDREIKTALSGAEKPYYALTPQAMAQRQLDDIAEVQARMNAGTIAQKDGRALITRIRNSEAYQSVTWTPQEVDELLDPILRSTEQGLTVKDTYVAMRDLLTLGELPEPRHFMEFVKVYGKEFADAVKAFASQPLTLRQKALDMLNLPRSVLASGDFSAMARQGLILGLTHPTKVPSATFKMFKAFASERLSKDMNDALLSKDITKKFVNLYDGYIAPLEKGSIISKREESFASSLAEKLPFVRQSERAYITYLNELRVASFDAAYNSMLAQGATEKQFKLLSKFINEATGRGELPQFMEKHADILNTFLFSPRLQASRLELPRTIGQMFLSGNPYVRKEAAKALTTFLGGGTALLMLLKAGDVADIETDPRSADFGKIKFKGSETRLDIWTGYLQYARFVAQMLTGESKSAYGNINKQERDQIAWRFLQSKSSPAFGLIVDLLRGENYQGEPLFDDTKGGLTAVGQRVIPLALQDIIDAFEQNGTNGIFQSAPGLFGVGALTYVNKFVQVKNKMAKQLGKESWDELDPITKKKLEQTPEFQAAALQFDRDSMGTAWGDWHSVGNAIEENFKNEVELASDQYAQTGDGVVFRKKVADAYIARQGAYQARTQDDRFSDIVARLNSKTPQEALVKLGAEQLATKTYQDALYGEDMTDEFGDYRWDEADIRREQLRQYLGDEMFNYVEEYLGMKYDDYPPAFQELRRAKTVLKPYWAVKDEVYKTYGEPKSKYQSAKMDALISKIRKRMRLTNAEMEKYYQMFYAQQDEWA